jgi:hypothetical protein
MLEGETELKSMKGVPWTHYILPSLCPPPTPTLYTEPRKILLAWRELTEIRFHEYESLPEYAK